MDLEHDLSRMLEESVVGLSPPVSAILDEANRRGRRLRRRRRLQTAAAAVAVVAVAGTGAAFGLRPAAAPPASVAGPTATGSAPARPAPSGAVLPVTSGGLLKVLTELLPKGKVTDFLPGREEDPGRSASLTARYDDGLSPVEVEVYLNSSPAEPVAPPCQPLLDGGAHRPFGAEPVRCNTVSFPDGTNGWSMVSPAYGNGMYYENVDLVRPDGSELRIRFYNGSGGTADEAASTVRAKPPISPDQLTALARDPRWNLRASAQPTADAPPVPRPSGS
ncbi:MULTISPECIES: hypothetical protein [Kitasatospora]|uniref:Uncharacterized protein n=1 Tax=Kitasatospora cystarginea TaxID=58350 RepID=A0ABN3DBK5_9ACTN